MKRFLISFAAMLLVSIGAFAQSSTPLKGDVNGDGVVDVADITAVIDIIKNNQGPTTYYLYVGTTKPTSLSQATTVTSYPAEQTYTNNSGAKSHIFVLTNSDKNVTFINPEVLAPVTQNPVDTTTIPGYKIFETSVGVANTGSILIRIYDEPQEETTYYWYVGQTDPRTMSTITPIVSDTSSPGWRLIGSTIGSYTLNNPLWDGTTNLIRINTTPATTYVALPNAELKVRDGDGNDVTTSVYTTVGTKTINNVTYYIYSVIGNKIFNAVVF